MQIDKDFSSDKIAIHCPTLELAKEVLSIFKRVKGDKCRNPLDTKYPLTDFDNINEYSIYGKETCLGLYFPYNCFSEKSWYEKNSYIIISAEQFIKDNTEIKQMEKQSITRVGLKDIYDVACLAWQRKIQEYAKRTLLSNTVEFTQEEVNVCLQLVIVHKKQF
jgi:hypothetical protein